MFDFPNSPTVGQQVTAANGVVYRWDGTKWAPIPGGVPAGVASFNTRSGAVTLLAADVTGALGFTPVQSVAGRTGAVTLTHTDITDWTATLAPYALTTSVPVASTTTPTMDGTAAVGTGTTWARADHVHPSDTSRVAKAGDTMTGALNINLASGGSALLVTPTSGNAGLSLARPAGQLNFINGYTGSAVAANVRWQMQFGEGTAEAAGNAGSNFALQAFDNSGILLGWPLSIERKTGYTVLNGNGATALAATASAAGHASLRLNKAGSSNIAQVNGYNNGVVRWGMNLGDGTAEGGSNAGSDFSLSSYSDAGAFLSQALVIYRSNSTATFNTSQVAISASGTNYASLVLAKSGSGQANQIVGYTGAPAAATTRWVLQLGGPTAESGSNVGSNFNLNSFTDAGAGLGTPLAISRASGGVAITGNGATLTLPISNVAGDAALAINKNGAGHQSLIEGMNNGLMRWQIVLGDGSSESGANAGSNFYLQSYTDAGAGLANPISIVRSTGVCTFSAAIVNGPSDRRLKENIAPLEGSLDKVLALQGVSYNFIATPNKPEIGLIAQDVEPVVPEVVQVYEQVTDPTVTPMAVEPMMALDYPKLTALLIEAVKTLTARIEALEVARG